MRKSLILLNLVLALFLFSCKPTENPSDSSGEIPTRRPPKVISYQVKTAKDWLLTHKGDVSERAIVFAVNRTDSNYFAKMDSIIVPTDLSGELAFYLPFPLEAPYLKGINKIIYFSYPTQTFATYQKGILIYTGPTNMGRERDKTPTGLFFTNWKAEETTSSFNDEWDLRWNFNISNNDGIGWHQYNLPGYPMSHSCLRLNEADAKYLYTWADQWVLESKDSVKIEGTPVIVYGSYDFGAPKPWLQLVTNPHALDISIEELQRITEPHLSKILAAQQKREKVEVE